MVGKAARDKYIGGRRNAKCIRGEGRKKEKGGRRGGEETRRERLVGVAGGRRGADGGCGWRVSSRAALTWARKSMGPPTRTQTRSVEARTRPMPIIPAAARGNVGHRHRSDRGGNLASFLPAIRSGIDRGRICVKGCVGDGGSKQLEWSSFPITLG